MNLVKLQDTTYRNQLHLLYTNNQLSEKKNKEHNLIHNSTKNDKTLRNKFNQKDKDLYTKTIKLW